MCSAMGDCVEKNPNSHKSELLWKCLRKWFDWDEIYWLLSFESQAVMTNFPPSSMGYI